MKFTRILGPLLRGAIATPPCLALVGCPDPAAEKLDEMQRNLKALRLRRSARPSPTFTAPSLPPVRKPALGHQPSPAPLVDLDLDQDDPVLGKPEAKIAIVEFSDYQCPFCKRHHQDTFPKLKARYIDTGAVKYLFRDYLLPFHNEAKAAAVAANCVGLGAE